MRVSSGWWWWRRWEGWRWWSWVTISLLIPSLLLRCWWHNMRTGLGISCEHIIMIITSPLQKNCSTSFYSVESKKRTRELRSLTWYVMQWCDDDGTTHSLQYQVHSLASVIQRKDPWGNKGKFFVAPPLTTQLFHQAYYKFLIIMLSEIFMKRSTSIALIVWRLRRVRLKGNEWMQKEDATPYHHTTIIFFTCSLP